SIIDHTSGANMQKCSWDLTFLFFLLQGKKLKWYVHAMFFFLWNNANKIILIELNFDFAMFIS
ncbi:hypothetical protein ACJX0J_037174, partial [Zea mays]